VLATGLQNKYTGYGLYDSILVRALAEPYLSNKFKHIRLTLEDIEIVKKMQSVFEFDTKYRSRFFLYRSAHRLYRDVSCGRHVPDVDVPFLVLLSNDDPITKVELVPHSDLYNNDHCVLVEAN
jgi:predicted alpha/beta-fold hydrolase